MDFNRIIANTAMSALPRDAIAEILNTTPGALEAFEASYKKHVLDEEWDDGAMFNISAKQVKSQLPPAEADAYLEEVVDRIVHELESGLQMMEYDGKNLTSHTKPLMLPGECPLANKDLALIPKERRPQLTGDLMAVQVKGDTAGTLMAQYYLAQTAQTQSERRLHYNRFRQGLDILDLDGLSYEMLSMNPNAISHWLPGLAAAVSKQNFFKIPKTKVMKVPMTLLQLSRLDYGLLTPVTKRIVDKFCFEAFGLDENKEYFIKTGTFSSKFDFRNAHVVSAKEVRELGEYLLFISNMAVQMASPLSSPAIYGVSTTNEWVVREYIPDVENNPCIYKGMPLRTEYRVFVDFDSCEILGISPYWEPEMMKKRFGTGRDKDSPHQFHDYVIFKAHEKKLMERYEANKDEITNRLQAMLPDFGMTGQWSVDIMQSGKEFYIIDMATAATSALSDCVPKGKLKPVPENWLPCIESVDKIGGQDA